MLSAVFCAVEEDNVAGLEELLSMANIDITQVNSGNHSLIKRLSSYFKLARLSTIPCTF